jgi:AraC-like DNA-binding protein
MEICLLARGRQSYKVFDRDFHLRGGDVFVTYPDETHSTGGFPEEKGLLYWLTVLDPRQTHRSFLGLPKSESDIFWKALVESDTRQFRATPEMRRHLDSVLHSLHHPEPVLSHVSRTHHLTGFLLAFIEARKGHPVKPEIPRFSKVMQHVQACIDDPAALDVHRLAELAELSVSRFKARFKSEIGVPPGEYVLRARIQEAQKRLSASPKSITDIAVGLGFSSSQYFASSFKRITNTTPTAFRRNLRPGT